MSTRTMRMSSYIRLAAVAALLAVGTAIRPAAAGVTRFTIDPQAILSADRTQVTVSGTIQCDTTETVTVGAEAAQVIRNKSVVSNSIGVTVVCGTTVQAWSLTLTALSGKKFQPGIATVLAAVTLSDSSVVGPIAARVVFRP